MRSELLLLTISAALTLSGCSDSSRPSFDSATIKLNTACGPGQGSTGERVSAGKLTITCYQLWPLIQDAFDTFSSSTAPDSQQRLEVTGGPAWIRTDRFDIDATARNGAEPAIMLGPMLRELLQDRFGLVVHRESREVPTYSLTIARGGIKATPSTTTNCPPGQCGVMHIRPGRNGTLDSTAATTKQLAAALINIPLDRPVIDKTGLTTRFDFHLEFTRDKPRTPASEDTQAAVFAAIQEQLGLQLVPDKGDVEVLAIDHIERPAEF